MDVIDILMAKMLSGSGSDPEAIASAVSDWLEENVDPVGSAVVVDSTLTISGAAADAKVTGEKIGDLKSDLSDVTVFYDDELGIDFRPIERSASSSSTPFEQIRILDLPLVAGKTYQIDWSIPTEVSPYIVYCFLSDGHGNNLIQSRIVAGDTQKTNIYTASANNDDAYLYFTVGNTQTTVTASVTMLNATPTRIESLESSVADLEETTVKTVETRSVEITNPDTGHYINKSGVYSESNPFSISQPFYAYAGETIEVKATGYNNGVAMIAQVKSDYPYTVLAVSRSSVEETYTYSVLEDITVVVSYNNTKPCVITVKKIYDLDVIPQMQAESRDAKWKYAFDRICCIGDSLTSGSYYAGTWGGASIAQNYPAILSRMLNTPVKNSGRSGASAKSWYTNNMAGLTLTDYGTFVIWLGTNGGLTDTIDTDVDPYVDYNDFADTNTGYLCRTICQIKATVPDAHIMICTVFSTTGDLTITNDVINQIATKYSLQLVDNSDLDNTNYPQYHSNTVHFNKAGNIFIADRIKNEMISYVAPDGHNAEFGLTARTD